MTTLFNNTLHTAIRTPYTQLLHEAYEQWEQAIEGSEMLSAGRDVLRILDNKFPGSENLAVGGTVRDLLMGKPIKDVDIATNVPMKEIERLFKAHDIGKSKDFGIVTIRHKGHDFEVAQFRQDGESSNSRHPDSVTFAKKYKDDASRRDLTINSLGIDADGVISDYHGGLKDIHNKVIRAVGEPTQRFEEDALRIYRMLRFAAKTGFDIDPATYDAAKKLVSLGKTDSLSIERVRDELWKSASSGKSLARYVTHLKDIGLLSKVFPELCNLYGKEHNPEHHPEGCAGLHTVAAVNASRSNDPLTNIAILFHDVGKGETYELKDGKHTFHGHESKGSEMLNSIARKLKLSNNQKQALQFAASKHMLLHKARDLNNKTITGIVSSPYWPLLKDVGYADIMSRGPTADSDQYDADISYMENIVADMASGQDLEQKLKSVITGRKILDWIPELNTPQLRPLIGTIHKQVRDYIINNNAFNISETELKKLVVDMYESVSSIATEKFSTYIRYR